MEPMNTIGIITPYRQQVNELQNQFQQVFSNQQQLLRSIEINTVVCYSFHPHSFYFLNLKSMPIKSMFKDTNNL
jgi:hypothetical protein